MSIQDVLKDYVPTQNQDGVTEVLKGTYKCSITDLSVSETKQDPKRPCYKLELTVDEVLEGNGSAGRRFWRTYLKDEDESVKKFLNDLFTSGLDLPRTSVEDFEASFVVARDHGVTVRSWGWTPDKKQDGTPIPEAERMAVQQFKIVNASKVKVKAKNVEDVPF